MVISQFGLVGLDLVDLGCQDEVVFAQPANRVSPNFDPHLSIFFEVKVGVMSFGFRNFTNGVEEVERLDEVFHSPVFADALVVIG